jgi:DNA-binding response OmpR family regulator
VFITDYYSVFADLYSLWHTVRCVVSYFPETGLNPDALEQTMGFADRKTVLVIEDDPNTAKLVVLYLEKEGYAAVQAHDGRSGLHLAAKYAPALIILDLMLPEMDGWEVCRQLRKSSDVPVIMLTARGEEVDRVSGLTLGADDYVVKPFSPRELVARVQAVLRRTAPSADGRASRLVCQGVTLDLDKRRLTVEGTVVPLTPHEYALLETLMSAPGAPLPETNCWIESIQKEMRWSSSVLWMSISASCARKSNHSHPHPAIF